eukprot:5831082-Prymnesium_polylepis.1
MKGRKSPSQPFLDQGHGWWARTPRVEAVSASRRLYKAGRPHERHHHAYFPGTAAHVAASRGGSAARAT